MAKEKEEETSKNQPEEETSKNSQEEKPEEKSDEVKGLEARLAHHKKKQKEAEEKIKEVEEKQPLDEGTRDTTDPFEVAKLSRVLADYSDEEINFIKRNADGDSPEEIVKATKDEFVQTAIKSKRQKVENDKQTPTPTSKQPSADKGEDFSSWTPKQIKNASKEERSKYAGWMRKQGKRS